MIKYVLKCENDHSFESWFQSAGAFEDVRSAGHLTCIVCGSGAVDKAVMAPRVSGKGELSQPQTEAEASMAAMRKHVEENSTYVGGSFASEARAMHDGDAPQRAIWGEAKPAEAKALLEDGVPVAPLPFGPRHKSN